MNSKQFLTIGGIVLLLVGILGFVGPIGPTAADSIFHSAWFFDNAENWAHTVLGLAALISLFVLPMKLQKYLTIVVGILALFFGVYSLMGPVTEGVNFMGAQLQNPADTILHLVVGVWALWAAMRTTTDMMPSSASMPSRPM